MKKLGIAIAVVLVLFFAVVLVAGRIATSKAHEEAAKLSQEWGRPVSIGSVSIKLLTGLGVRVSDVLVGPGEGEGEPLATVKDVEVKAALLKAAFSRGKDVEVRSAVIDGLTINLIRLPDGTTNLERLQSKISPEKKPAEEPKEEKPSDLSFLKVDHAALREGTVALLDRSSPGKERDLAVKHFDVTVDNLRAGSPLEVVVKAALLAEQQNFELHLKAAPLPKSLMPTPTALTLKLQPVDLAPLGPFLGKGVGLQGGKLDADFDMQLGAAMPGGTGPTSVKGAIHALALRFAGAEGGKALDAVVDTNVTGDAQKGDVAIDKLRIDIGPAGISGSGRAHAVNTASPQIEGLTITSHDLDPAKLAAYYPPLRKTIGSEVEGPIGLSLKGGGTQAAQSLELTVDLTPVRLAIPQQLTKAAGAPMTLTASVRGAAATNGPVNFAIDAKLDGVDLRPGESLAKAPGQKLDLALTGTRDGDKITLSSVKLNAIDDEVDGHGSADLSGGKKKAELALTSAHIDLDKLLLPSDPKKKKEAKPPPDPKTFQGVDAHATVRIDKLTMSKQVMTGIVADVTLQEDVLKVQKAQLQAFGGTADASGTQVRLAHPEEPFHVVTKITNVEMENALALFTTHKLLSGKFNGNVDFQGGGQAKEELVKTLAGALDGHLLDGNFFGKDLIASVTGPLTKALPSALSGKVTQGGTTTLGHDLPVGIKFANGAAQLSRPLSITRPEANMSFTGGIHLDGMLDLPGKIELTPATISQITGGKAKVQGNIPFSVHLTGPAWNPTVSDLDLKPAVTEIIKDAGASLIGKAVGVDLGSGGAQQKVDQVKDQAQKKVQDEAAQKLKGLFGK
ncbi:MAG TPA: AsmA-like C-terminal region-containing protein [Myxococcales bacterium]|jgi:AsmA protein